MNEVSVKSLTILFKPLEKKGVSVESVLVGSAVTKAKLADKKSRIDWADLGVILRNLRLHYTDEEYTELGREWMRSPGLKFAFVIARLMFSAMDFYRWMNKPRDGVGNQMFSCIMPTHREPGPYQIEMDLEVKGDLEVIWEFFLISKGNMEELPKLLGLPRSKVVLERLPRGGRFHIKVPEGIPFFARVWRFLTRPFVRRDVAKELKEAHENLLERYEELESAQLKLDRQATQLRTAHSVNVLVQRDVDVDGTLHTVTQALVEEAGFAWAEITLSREATAHHGQRYDGREIERVLEGRGGEKLGRLSVMPRAGADHTEREDLLSFITPSLAIALQNAIYRGGLEQLVDQRTAELSQARDTLAGTVEQLKDAQGAREKFFGNVSHEIRTPLSIVLLAVSDIEKRAKDKLDPRSVAALGSINDSANKLLRLVDELLLLAAGQEGKLTTQLEPTNLGLLITALISAWTPAAETAGLELASTISASLVANVDQVAIERVATNLLSNAMKYTPRGGKVAVELANESEGIRLSVLDTGPGISDELATRLFGRFERAHGEHRKVAGAGIGLSLVKQLVEAHGGTVQALRRPTGGTEMRVILPAERVLPHAPALRLTEPAIVAPAANADSEITTPASLSQGTILIAEDDVRLAEMIANLLSENFTVRIAHDGATALELAKKYQPQLLITDIDMPVMDGLELAQRFREVTNDLFAPIIILSAVLDLGTRVAGITAGAMDYITKPFDPAELRARVHAQFRIRGMAMRLHRAEQLSTLGVLTAALAHEIRNPANGVINAIPPLKALLPPELTKPDEAVGQLLDVLSECAEQITVLSRQLLGFRNDASELLLRPANLHDLVNRALSIMKEQLRESELRIDIEKDLQVKCAPPLLIQVLTNLLENAAHASRAGGWIEVTASVANDHVSLEIADSGPGIPIELRTKVFEPFFTTKPQGIGTGLGLPVSREIMTRHGGTLEIRDRGPRSVFVVQMPQLVSLDVVARTGS